MHDLQDERAAMRMRDLRRLLDADRLTTAKALAAELGVSDRTIYRMIAKLRRQGMSIRSGAGIGYMGKRNGND